MSALCHLQNDDPEAGWEWLWPMCRKTAATPLWASDDRAEGPAYFDKQIQATRKSASS